jgi:hypothetical protein
MNTRNLISHSAPVTVLLLAPVTMLAAIGIPACNGLGLAAVTAGTILAYIRNRRPLKIMVLNFADLQA